MHPRSARSKPHWSAHVPHVSGEIRTYGYILKAKPRGSRGEGTEVAELQVKRKSRNRHSPRGREEYDGGGNKRGDQLE